MEKETQKQVAIRILTIQVLISNAPHKILGHKMRDTVIFLIQKVLSHGSRQRVGTCEMQKGT